MDVRLIRDVARHGPRAGQRHVCLATGALQGAARLAAHRRPAARRRDALVLVLGGPRRGLRLRGRERAVCDRPEHAVRQLDDAVRRGGRAGIVQRRKLPAAIHRIGLVSRLDSGPLRPGHAGADRAVALSDRSVAGRSAGAVLRSADLREKRLSTASCPANCRGAGRRRCGSAMGSIEGSG